MRTPIQPENYFLEDQSTILSISGDEFGKKFNINAQEFNEFVSNKKGLTKIAFSNIDEIPEDLVFPDSVKKIEITISEGPNLKFPDSAPECKNLEELEISICPSLKKLFPLSNFPNLKVLKIFDSNKLKTIPSLLDCKNLERVNISLCDQLELESEPESLLDFTNLKEFIISSCNKITKIYELPKSIKRLVIGYCQNLTTLQPLSDFPELKTLVISKCQNLQIPLNGLQGCLNLEDLEIKDDKITEFPEITSLTNLIRLNLAGCANLTPLPDLSSLTNLKEINLTECRNLTTILGLSNLTNLRYLNLKGCENLTTLPDLSNLAELWTLNLTGCENLTTLPELSNLAELWTLNLTGCTNLTTLPDLSSITNLQELNLTGCTNLTTLPDLSSLTNLKELNLFLCKNLVTLPDLSSLTNLQKINLSGCKNLTTLSGLSNLTNLKELNLSLCENLTTLPGLSNLTNLQGLTLTYCKNLTTLPDLSNLTNLQELTLTGCNKLEFTPELIEKLSTLEGQGCSIIYPSHFKPSDLTDRCKDRLKKVIRDFEQNNKHLPEIKDGIYELFERFLTEGIGNRIDGGDNLRKKANKIAKSTEPFLDFIEKNPQHLPWINDTSKGYIEGCVNQPVWGFFEISVLTKMAKEEKFSDKVILAKALVAIRGIVGIVAEENKKLLNDRVAARVEVEEGVGISVEVEAGNVLLIKLHEELLKQKIIEEPWPGVPEKIAHQGIVINWCNKKHIQEQLNDLVEKIQSINQEGCINYLCATHYKDIWHQIAFPNNQDIENIITRHKTEIDSLETDDKDYYPKIGEMGKTLDNKITDKFIQLTRAEIDKEANEINPQQPVPAEETQPSLSQILKELRAKDLRDLGYSLDEPLVFQPHISFPKTLSERDDSFPSSSSFSRTYENGVIKFKIKSGSSEDSGENPAGLSVLGKFDYNKKLDANEKYNQDEYTQKKEQEKILALLTEVSEATKQKFPSTGLDKDFFIAVMKVASENRGIANFDNSKAFEEALTKFNPQLDTSKYNLEEGAFHKIAKYFSAKFQKLSEKDGYLTAREGRGNEVNKTPRRLFRVCTEKNIKAFKNMQIEEILQKREVEEAEIKLVAPGPLGSPRSASVVSSLPLRTLSKQSLVGGSGAFFNK